ncbi:MAG: ABC transporter permease [Anaerolineae bacterium]|nr:ABC transporter permease [Anaerolineae bacterium]
MTTNAPTTTKPRSESPVIDLAQEEYAGESLTRLALRRLRRDYLTLIALIVLITLVLLSLLAPVITDVFDLSYTDTRSSPGFLKIGAPGHPLGTDDLGRDHLARLLYAGRVSLGIGVSAALGSVMIGMTLGVMSGYYQGGALGIVDDLMMWFITTLNSVPYIFLLLIISAVLTPTVWSLIFILTVLGWTGTMRLVRGETLAQREREYVVAARALGASSWRIMFMHILPNVFSILIVTLALDIGSLILVESALSFLGLGVRPPTPSWGNMLSNAQSFFERGAHLVMAPGILIVITVLCLYIVGDGLRDAFDPRAVKKA